MQSKAYVIGWGQTKCGFYPERDMRSLISEAYIKALQMSKVEPKEIQQMWLSHYPLQCDLQATAGQVAIDAVGLGSRVGCITIEQACCSGGQAIHDTVLGIESGRYDCVLLVGFGKMGDTMRPIERPGIETPSWRIGPFEESGFNPFFNHAGVVLNPPGEYSDYFKAYNVTADDVAAWNVLEYWYATKNPNALCYKERIPTMKELSAIGGGQRGATGCDGASAVILGSREFAKRYTDKLVCVAGVSHKLETSYYPKMLDYGYGGDVPRGVAGPIVYSHSVENAWDECFEQAKVKPQDLDFLLPHDCTLTVTYAHMEGMRHPLIPHGKASKWFTEGEAYPGGKLPCCTLGSARFGQPRGASCVNYLIEGTQQLREECGDRQVRIKKGVTAGGTSPGRPAFFIMKREK